jgi:membrane protein
VELLGTVRTIVKVLQENYAPLVAGNLAYSAFASIRPLLTLASVASTSLSILLHAWLLEPLPLVVLLAIAFLPVFYVFPDANVTVREVLPGVVLTALGWAAL